RIRVLHLVDDATYEEKPEAENDVDVPDWPGPSLDELDADPPDDADRSVVTGCGQLEGDAASELFEEALENPTPHWFVEGEEEIVITVMLLPDEPACG